MSILNLRTLGAFTLLFLWPYLIGCVVHASSTSQKDGKLIVNVTWGDIDNTSANDVYVEAYGFIQKYDADKSFVLKMSQNGQYEASLPPGRYDVFVSEAGSVPRCRRVLIKPGLTTHWTLKLEIDDVYTNQQIYGTNR